MSLLVSLLLSIAILKDEELAMVKTMLEASFLHCLCSAPGTASICCQTAQLGDTGQDSAISEENLGAQ